MSDILSISKIKENLTIQSPSFLFICTPAPSSLPFYCKVTGLPGGHFVMIPSFLEMKDILLLSFSNNFPQKSKTELYIQAASHDAARQGLIS